jgi:sugar phosphate isomerase/epimerase
VSPVFGISTHLFHAQRLDRDHLVEVAAHGFEAVELYATRTHFDYHDAAAAAALREWLDDTRLSLHSVHAPTSAGYTGGRWGETITIGATDEARRKRAVDEARAALGVARVVPFQFLVLHLGFPAPRPADNGRDAVRRSVEELHESAQEAGVRLALELIPNTISTATSLVRWLEVDLEIERAGICLDVGHANLVGDVVEAIEECSGHILTTHLHDNRGKSDDHLVPGQGAIDWDAAMLAFQKVGYDGAWIFELAPSATPAASLERARKARHTFDELLNTGNEMLGGD